MECRWLVVEWKKEARPKLWQAVTLTSRDAFPGLCSDTEAGIYSASHDGATTVCCIDGHVEFHKQRELEAMGRANDRRLNIPPK